MCVPAGAPSGGRRRTPSGLRRDDRHPRDHHEPLAAGCCPTRIRSAWVAPARRCGSRPGRCGAHRGQPVQRQPAVRWSAAVERPSRSSWSTSIRPGSPSTGRPTRRPGRRRRRARPAGRGRGPRRRGRRSGPTRGVWGYAEGSLGPLEGRAGPTGAGRRGVHPGLAGEGRCPRAAAESGPSSTPRSSTVATSSGEGLAFVQSRAVRAGCLCAELTPSGPLGRGRALCGRRRRWCAKDGPTIALIGDGAFGLFGNGDRDGRPHRARRR